MCGILGGNRENWNYREAIEAISHRGPDAQKLINVKNFHLGFARLSIIDLQDQAMQPMFSSDGNYVILFNGEIYDYHIVRKELETRGYQFRTMSDTEVLLYAFVEWKEAMVHHLDGIFATAIMDIREEKIYLFRDRPGVKPLYYYYDGASFAFASELKAIEKMCTDIKFQIDNTALYDYYNYLYIPEPKTIYRNVYKLEAATCMVFDLKKNVIVTNYRYWKVRLNTKAGEPVTQRKMEEKAEELRYHMANVIKRQVVSDVPVGTFLSGGVDSSIVTAVSKAYIPNITGYTIGFTDKKYDELEYAKKIAELLRVKLKVKRFTRNNYFSLRKLLPQIYDEPFADTSAYPTFFVSKFAKEDITVVLTGDGGDELFGGYPRCLYALDNLTGKRRIPRKQVSSLYMDYENAVKKIHIDFDTFFKDDVTRLLSLYHGGVLDRKRLRQKYSIDRDYDDAWYIRKYYHKDLPPFTRMRYLDFMTYLPGDILTKVDRASMKVSLEARVPFLDKEIIDFAFSLTQQECNPNGDLKGLLKYAYKDTIPLDLFNRKKAGFSMPHCYVSGEGNIQEILLHKLWRID